MKVVTSVPHIAAERRHVEHVAVDEIEVRQGRVDALGHKRIQVGNPISEVVRAGARTLEVGHDLELQFLRCVLQRQGGLEIDGNAITDAVCLDEQLVVWVTAVLGAVINEPAG
jgi:hypothetical protein